MALSTRQIGASAAAATGVAAATARVGNGGRNVANTSRPDVEKLDFAPHFGINEESILRFQQDNGQLNPDGRRQNREPRSGFTPLLARSSFGIENLDNLAQDSTPRLFLTDVMRGIGSYESNIRVTSPASVKPGSVMNYLF
jgi:hypothetical protein